MALETGNVIWDLNAANPAGGDSRRAGDDHLRLIKSVLRGTFMHGNTASRPSAGTAYRFYFDTEAWKIYWDDGSVWNEMSPDAPSTPQYFYNSETISTTDTLLAGDKGTTFWVDTSSGDIPITLPAEATAGDGWAVTIIKATSDANLVNVLDDAGATIEVLGLQGDRVTPLTDGTVWTKLQWPKHSCQVYSQTLQTLTSGLNKLDLSLTAYDPYKLLSTADDAIKIKKAGRYQAVVGMNLNAEGPGNCQVFKNGAVIVDQDAQAMVDMPAGWDLEGFVTVCTFYAEEDDLICVYGETEAYSNRKVATNNAAIVEV